MDYGQFTTFASSPLLLKLFPAVYVLLFSFYLARKDEENVVVPFLSSAALIITRDIAGFFFPLESIFLISDLFYLVILAFSMMFSVRRPLLAVIFAVCNGLFIAAFFANLFLRFLPSYPFAFNSLVILGDLLVLVGFGLTLKDDAGTVSEQFASNAWKSIVPVFAIYSAVTAFTGYSSPVSQYLAMPFMQFGAFFALFGFTRIYANRLIVEQERLEETIDMTYSFVERSGEVFKTSVNLEQLLEYVVQSVSDQVRADGGLLFLVDEFDDLITVRASVGNFPPIVPLPEDLPRKASRIESWTRHMNFKIGETAFGDVAKTGKYLFIEDTGGDPRVTLSGDEDFLKCGSVIIVPLMVSGRIIGVLAVARKDREDAFSEKEFERVRLLSDFGALIISTLFSFIENSERNDIEREAGIALDIQKMIMPKKFPELPSASFGAFTLPARGVCSDFYEVLRPRKDRIVIAMCDVAGKGIQASLVMVMIRSILNLVTNSDQSTATILSWINRGITGKIDVDHFATLSVLSVDASTGMAEYANASHQPMMIYRNGLDSMETVEAKSLPIGVDRQNQYERRELKLEDGDVVILYTDGIVEAMNHQGRQYGRKSLSGVIKQHHDLSAKEIANKVKADLQDFAGQARQHDDQSLLVMKFSI